VERIIVGTARARVRQYVEWHLRRRAQADAAIGIAPNTIGRIAAITFITCGILGLVGLWLPVEAGADPLAVTLVTSAAILFGVIAWVLPWNSWPRSFTHLLVPLGFALIGVALAFLGDFSYAFGAMFCVIFTAVGLAHRPGTAVFMLPLFAAAYVIPLVVTKHDLSESLSFAAFFGVMCLVVAETVAWITARFTRTQKALLRARTALNDISADLTSVDARGLARSASTRLSLILEVGNVDVYSLAPDGGLTCLASVAGGASLDGAACARRDLVSWKAGARAAATKEPVLETGGTTTLAIPLVARERVMGLVEAVEERRGRTIAPDKLANALSVCALIALSIQDAEALAAKEAQAMRLASLLESSQAVTSADDLEEALSILAQRAAKAVCATECVAYEYMRDIDAIVPRAMWELAPKGWNRLGNVMPLSQYPVERKILRTGQPLLENLSDDLDPASRKVMVDWDEKSCFTVPMRSADGPMGLLVFFNSDREREYSEDERTLADGLADLAGEAVRRARLVRTLQRLSGTDSLTGLANHRQIHELLTREQARAERHGLGFSLVMLDVDGFKLLNDTYGHPLGDTALRHIATILQNNARTSDVVGRYGGDEFVLILPETKPDEAYQVIEKMRAAIAEKPFITPAGEKIPVRASFGIAAYPQDGTSVNELVVAADSNLYVSKRRGGNSITRTGHGDAGDDDEKTSFGILESMVTAVDNKDRYTRHHSEQATEYALLLGSALGLSESSLRAVRAGSLLHDVGKIGIPDRILRKPGRLTAEEWAIVKGHPSMGEALVQTMPDLNEIHELVASHHEHFDGTGYPRGLAGTDIPLLARILTVADAYAAMISDRPYRKAFSREAAIAELRKGAGTLFDPGIVSTFIQCIASPYSRPRQELEPAAEPA
jgi:diguanylate cyclase (GGDEF)-like protein